MQLRIPSCTCRIAARAATSRVPAPLRAAKFRQSSSVDGSTCCGVILYSLGASGRPNLALNVQQEWLCTDGIPYDGNKTYPGHHRRAEYSPQKPRLSKETSFNALAALSAAQRVSTQQSSLHEGEARCQESCYRGHTTNPGHPTRAACRNGNMYVSKETSFKGLAALSAAQQVSSLHKSIEVV